MPSTRRRLLIGLSAPLLLLSVTGCERFIPGSGPPPQLYQLSPKNTFPENLPQVSWQLTVEVPFASTALNATRIAIMPTPMQVDYYARAAWTDRVPLMVQTLIVESFENSRRIVGIGRDTIGLRSDFVLKTELREFQSESFHPQGGLVRVALDAKLVRMPERTIVASAEFRETAPASVDEMTSVIAAYDDALGRVMKRLVIWTLESGERARRHAASVSGVAAPTAPAAPASPPAQSGQPAPRPHPPAAAEVPLRR